MMDLFDDARPLEAKELLEICGNKEYSNPAGRLFFLELKGMNDPERIDPVLIYNCGAAGLKDKPLPKI